MNLKYFLTGVGVYGVFSLIIYWFPIPKRIEPCNHSMHIVKSIHTITEINTECIKGTRYVIVDNRKIRLKKFDKNALNQVSDIYCYD